MPSSGNSTWQNDPSTATALSAARFNNIESALGASVAKAGDTVTGTLVASGGTTSTHSLTALQNATSGTGSAVNVSSQNPALSAVQVSGVETGTGTIKVSHHGQADGSDASAAALSIDVRTVGTAAQGIFVTGTDGATSGNLITLRNNSRDDFVVKGTGRVGVGVATGATPGGVLDIRQPDNSTKGLFVQAFSTSASALAELRNSAGTPTTVISKDGDLAALGSALGMITPANHGLTAWSYDPAIAINTQVLTNGTVYLVKVHISLGATVTKLYWHVGVVGATPTSGQNEVGLYSSAGTRLAATNVDADITSTGLKSTTISSQALTTGATYWVGFVFNASTAPALARSTGLAGVGGLINAGLSAASYRFATNGTAQTSLPASVTPGSASQGISLWAAVGP